MKKNSSIVPLSRLCLCQKLKEKKKQTAPDRFPYSKAQPHFHVTFCRKCFKSEIFLFILYYFMGIINIKYQLKRQFKFSSSTKQNKFLTLHQI